MSVRFGFPPTLHLVDPGEESLEFPGLISADTFTGEQQARNHSDVPLRGYQIILDRLDEEFTRNLLSFRMVLAQTESGVEPFYLRVPIQRYEAGFLCGRPGDGVETVFPVGLQSPTDLRLESVDYLSGDRHGAELTISDSDPANLLQSNYAASPDDSDKTFSDHFLSNGLCTIEHVVGAAAYGSACCKVVPTGSQTNVGIRVNPTLALMAPVTVGETYGSIGQVRGDGNFGAAIRWYNGTSYLSQAATTGYVATTSEWLDVSTSGVAPASATHAAPMIYRAGTASAEEYLADCFGVMPFEAGDWFLPEYAPTLVKLSAALTDGHRIKASGKGYPIIRGKISGDVFKWTTVAGGLSTPKRFKFLEEIER